MMANMMTVPQGQVRASGGFCFAGSAAGLGFASKLTETPSYVGWDDLEALKETRGDRAVWEITALVSFFNISGRLEAESGLPPDQVPDGAELAEARIP